MSLNRLLLKGYLKNLMIKLHELLRVILKYENYIFINNICVLNMYYKIHTFFFSWWEWNNFSKCRWCSTVSSLMRRCCFFALDKVNIKKNLKKNQHLFLRNITLKNNFVFYFLLVLFLLKQKVII